MKLAIHLLSLDTEYGNSIEAFATEDALLARQKALVRERTANWGEAAELSALLDTDFSSAWEQFTETESYDNNYFATDEQEVDFPDPVGTGSTPSPSAPSNPAPDVFVCDNCGAEHEEGALLPVKDLEQRVDPGGIVPAGECPHCGCLCYPKPPHATVIVGVSGGVAEAHTVPAGIRLEIRDYDNGKFDSEPDGKDACGNYTSDVTIGPFCP